MDAHEKQDEIRILDRIRTVAHDKMLRSFAPFINMMKEQVGFEENDYQLENRVSTIENTQLSVRFLDFWSLFFHNAKKEHMQRCRAAQEEYNMKRSASGKLAVMLLAFCIAFTGLPMLAGDLDASAAVKLPSKITLKAKSSGQTKAVLTWNRIKKPDKGFAVFRNGTLIKHLSKKTVNYTDTGLKAGTAYRYQIKTYKVKKTKQWYNKKMGKWQKKKPAKKYRGKSRKVMMYSYGNASKAVAIKTAAATKPSTPSSQTKPTTPSPSGSGTTVPSSGSGSSGSGNTPSVQDGGNTGSGIDSGGSTEESFYYTGKTRTVTNYLGKTRTCEEFVDNGMTGWTGVSYPYDNNAWAKVDRTVDGEFEISGGTVMLQKGGVTFNIPTTSASDDMNRAMYVYMYNGDINKLGLTLEDNTTSVPTYTYSQERHTRTYVMSGKYRLAEILCVHEVTGLGHTYIKKTDNLKIKTMCFDDLHCGFVSGNVNIRVSYDYNGNGTYENNEYIGTSVYKVSADPARAEALRIATLATADTNSYDADMAAIRQYIKENYKATDSFEGVPMSCVGGAYIIETWSIDKYGVYGFFSYGSCPPGSVNYGDHVAFYPEPNNYSGRPYYEAGGEN